ncbi:hypothetical protein BV25DRAFT_1831613 [Artomyces pyxidatus]|uniref:Uncharacterized protein n=1 Tax=Artomyces pyxidatus TaxID=48021 RepID=A0ACB8SLA5_9AGAM|nr:hypothetical protein BV25DRAFT_1831613 [Artomyces pyxidatus]
MFQNCRVGYRVLPNATVALCGLASKEDDGARKCFTDGICARKTIDAMRKYSGFMLHSSVAEVGSGLSWLDRVYTDPVAPTARHAPVSGLRSAGSDRRMAHIVGPRPRRDCGRQGMGVMLSCICGVRKHGCQKASGRLWTTL